MSTTSFIDAVKARRSVYTLTNTSPIPDSEIISLAQDAVKYCPSSFNTQSTRLVVLLKEEHEKLWDFTAEILKAIVPEDQWAATEGKMKAFRGAYGTILFFEDRQPIKEAQTKFALYADKFPQWSEHTSAIHQYTLWVALNAAGLGCNLQHYTPLVDQKVKAEWKVDDEYQLVAQLVFGTPTAPAGPRPGIFKTKPLEETVRVFGA